MLQAEQADQTYVEAVQQGRKKFVALKEACEQGAQLFSNEYNQPLAEMRDILTQAASDFGDDYT
jgi:hypothetical protein